MFILWSKIVIVIIIIDEIIKVRFGGIRSLVVGDNIFRSNLVYIVSE